MLLMKVMIELSVWCNEWLAWYLPCVWLIYETWCIRRDGDVEFCLIVTHHLHLVYNVISRCMYVIMQPIIDPVARMTIVRFVLALSVLHCLYVLAQLTFRMLSWMFHLAMMYMCMHHLVLYLCLMVWCINCIVLCMVWNKVQESGTSNLMVYSAHIA